MKKIVTILLLVCACTASLSARTKNKARYEGTFETGFVSYFDPLNSSYGNWHTFDFTTTHGVRFNKNFFMGLGTGVTTSMIGLGVPLYLDFKGYFTRVKKRKAYPYLDARLGANFQFAEFDNYAIGAYCNLSVGCNYEISKKSALFAAIGIQTMSLWNSPYLGPVCRIGVSF